MESHPQHASHISKYRFTPVIYHFVGEKFPRSDRVDDQENYARYVLALFHPWRTVSDLLPSNDDSWSNILGHWLATVSSEGGCPQWVRQFLKNIHSLHEGTDQRDELRQRCKQQGSDVSDSNFLFETESMIPVMPFNEQENMDGQLDFIS